MLVKLCIYLHFIPVDPDPDDPDPDDPDPRTQMIHITVAKNASIRLLFTLFQKP